MSRTNRTPMHPRASHRRSPDNGKRNQVLAHLQERLRSSSISEKFMVGGGLVGFGLPYVLKLTESNPGTIFTPGMTQPLPVTKMDWAATVATSLMIGITGGTAVGVMTGAVVESAGRGTVRLARAGGRLARGILQHPPNIG